MKVTFEESEVWDDLLVPPSEIFKAFRKPEEFKNNKDIVVNPSCFPRMVLKKLSKKSIHKAVGECLCSTQYCQKSNIETEEVLKIRKEYWLKKNFAKDTSRNHFLKAKLESQWDKKKKKIEYRLAGSRLCQAAFIKVIGCSKKKVQDCVKLCKSSGTMLDRVSTDIRID